MSLLCMPIRRSMSVKRGSVRSRLNSGSVFVRMAPRSLVRAVKSGLLRHQCRHGDVRPVNVFSACAALAFGTTNGMFSIPVEPFTAALELPITTVLMIWWF